VFKAIFTLLPFLFFSLLMFLFVAPARMRVRAQAAWAMALLACASKFACYKAFGGDAFAPELPEKLIWTWNWAYSGMCLLLAMALLWRIARWVILAGPPRGRWKAVWLVGLPVVAWGAAAVGVWNGIKVPEVREVVVDFPNLPESLDGYRILHMTDFHASAAARRWRTEAIVERANAAGADLICLTGDYADGMSDLQAKNLEPLKGLTARDGVLAVTGNHEYYFDTYGWMRQFHRWGIDFLVNECAFPRPGLAVAGVSDSQSAVEGFTKPDPDTAFEAATNGEFRVLLQHRPFVDYERLYGWPMSEKCDLQLSGHTHGGVAPGLSWLVRAVNNGMARGLYRRGDGRVVHVSPGVGQWAGFPIRFFDDPEMTLLVLRRARLTRWTSSFH